MKPFIVGIVPVHRIMPRLPSCALLPFRICTLLLLFTLQVGCGTFVVDYLPKGARKGYVEFHPDGIALQGSAEKLALWETTEGYRKPVIRESHIIRFEKHSTRVAASPGLHTYDICIVPGPISLPFTPLTEPVSVDVREGHVTPIWIRCVTISSTTQGSIRTRQFKFSVEAGEPVPFKE
jgi:hypothetical protein